jgi:hypothetical protein
MTDRRPAHGREWTPSWMPMVDEGTMRGAASSGRARVGGLKEHAGWGWALFACSLSEREAGCGAAAANQEEQWRQWQAGPMHEWVTWRQKVCTGRATGPEANELS